MELLSLIRLLWRRRLVLAAGVALAVVAAVGLGGPPPRSSGLAWTRVALDTPSSELVDSAPSGYDTLPWRASLLSHLMATDATQRALAQRLGVRQDRVAVVDSNLAVPEVPDMVAKKAADASVPTGAAYVVTVGTNDPALPVISIQAAAPSPSGATRLAQAAVALLEAQASRGGPFKSGIRSNPAVPLRLQRFVVQVVAPLRVKRVVASAIPIKPIGAAIFILFASFAGALLLPRVRGGSRVELPPVVCR
jgi:hypothetical protein